MRSAPPDTPPEEWELYRPVTVRQRRDASGIWYGVDGWHDVFRPERHAARYAVEAPPRRLKSTWFGEMNGYPPGTSMKRDTMGRAIGDRSKNGAKKKKNTDTQIVRGGDLIQAMRDRAAADGMPINEAWRRAAAQYLAGLRR